MTPDGLVARLRSAGCVFAEEEAALLTAATDDPDELERLVRSRVAGLPLEHVLGWADFCGVRVLLEPGVFVPRPRSRRLVKRAIAAAEPGAVILDLCCGSGAVGLAVAAAVPNAQLWAADLDPDAVRVARRNLPPERVLQGDLYAPLPDSLRGGVDVLVVVAPYVPTAHIPLLPHEARDFEPLLALDGGDDGLALVRRILEGAGEWLAPTGVLLTEVSVAQAPSVVAIARVAGFAARADKTIVTVSRPG